MTKKKKININMTTNIKITINKQNDDETLRYKIQTSQNFRGVKLRQSQTLGGKIQILKRQCVKSKHPQTLGGKI